MLHVAQHYDDGFQPDQRRPDFPLYKHLLETEVMSADRYAIACGGTEYKLARPIAERSELFVNRAEHVAYQAIQRQEDREWRRQRQNQKRERP